MTLPAFQCMALFAMTLTCCAQNPAQPTELTSADSLVRALAQQGGAAVRSGSLPRSAYPFFSVAAQRLVLQGEDVQVFEYPNATAADRDASNVSPSGSPIGQSQIAWMDIPHFYKRDRLIVLYVGHTSDVLAVLQKVLGEPFAAGR